MVKYIFDNRLRFNRDGVLCVNDDFYDNDTLSPDKASRMTYKDGDHIRLLTFNEHSVFSSVYGHIMKESDDDGVHCCTAFQEDIASENGISSRTVRRAVNALVRMGLLIKSTKFYGRTLIYLPYHSNRLDVDKINSSKLPLFLPSQVINTEYAKVDLRKSRSVSKRKRGISSKLRFDVLNRDNFTCQYCGRKAPDVVLHVDHIIPVAKGGTNHISNLITACRDCNLGKSDREI